MYTGKCFCLYQEDTSLPVESVPHILESDITSTVLFLKRMEIAGLSNCDFVDRPGEILFIQSNLFQIIDRSGLQGIFCTNIEISL